MRSAESPSSTALPEYNLPTPKVGIGSYFTSYLHNSLLQSGAAMLRNRSGRTSTTFIPMLPRPLLTILALIGTALHSTAEFREFKDIKGRVIKAEPVKARGLNITMRLESGSEVPVALKTLCEADQNFLLTWISVTPAALDYRFDCKEGEKSVEGGNFAPGSSARYWGAAYTAAKQYEVSLASRCQNPINGLRICYRVFLEDRVSETGSTYGGRKLMYKSGNYELPTLSYNLGHKFMTRPHVMHKITATSSFYGTSERDRLRGVWVKFYRFGVEVYEWKSQTCAKCEWPAPGSDEKEALEKDAEKLKNLIGSLAASPAKPKPETPTVKAPAVIQAPEVKPENDMPEEMKIFDMDELKPAK